MHTLYLNPLGEVVLHLDTISVCGAFLYIMGYDRKHTPIKFAMTRLSCLDDIAEGFGYCRISSYTMNGTTTDCHNIIRALS